MGRKKTMFIYSIIKLTGIFMSMFGVKYAVFLIGRFLIGCGCIGFFLPGFVLRCSLAGRDVAL